MPQIIEYDWEFAQRHGGLSVLINDQRVFADGASMHHTETINRSEPPADPQSRLSRRIAFHTAYIEQAQADFDQLKACITGEAGENHLGLAVTFKWPMDGRYGKPPLSGNHNENSLQALKQIAAVVKHHRDTLQALQTEFDNLPSVKRERDRQEQLAESNRVSQELFATERADLLQQVSEVTIDRLETSTPIRFF